MALLDQPDIGDTPMAQARQDLGSCIYSTHHAAEEHGYVHLPIPNADVSTQESSSEDMLWDGLWNLDDFHGNLSAACAASKASLHHLVAPFY